jgi:hypothetical protein
MLFLRFKLCPGWIEPPPEIPLLERALTFTIASPSFVMLAAKRDVGMDKKQTRKIKTGRHPERRGKHRFDMVFSFLIRKSFLIR